MGIKIQKRQKTMLESWHDEQIIIEDATNESIEPQQVYFNTLDRQEG